MVDVLGIVDIPVPTFGIGTGRIAILFSMFLIVTAAIIMIWLIYTYRIYNKKVIVFENISGQGFQPFLRDRARLVKLGDGGEEILYLKKKGVYRAAYGRKMGKNTYWYAIGQDGYWYNVVLGDVDAKMGMLDIEPIDRDMRYMHVAIRKNIESRYNKQSFMEKYGTILMSGFFLLIMIIGIWFLLDKMTEISNSLVPMINSAKDVQEGTRQILSALENVCSGSGVRPA